MAISINLKYLAHASAAFGLCVNSAASDDGTNKTITTELALQDVPKFAKNLVSEARANFVVSEVLKKDRDPRFEGWSKESNYKLLSTRWEHYTLTNLLRKQTLL